MKASELIIEIQKQIDLHGDLEVGKFNDSEGYIEDVGIVHKMFDNEYEKDYIVII